MFYRLYQTSLYWFFNAYQYGDNNICKFNLCISVTNIFFALLSNLKKIFYVQGLSLVLKGKKKDNKHEVIKNILASITDDIFLNIDSVIGPKVHP